MQSNCIFPGRFAPFIPITTDIEDMKCNYFLLNNYVSAHPYTIQQVRRFRFLQTSGSVPLQHSEQKLKIRNTWIQLPSACATRYVLCSACT